MLQAIPVPAIQVSSCAFGGPNMDELYITTARGGMKEDALAKYPHAGGVFKIKTSVQGMPSYKFGG